ncbi:uncharacterized protein LOC117900521 isoform X2 [Drosophila subobscura]|uniref:uncharacterized protein LOC117900521 isoform X2 n=1 Tax=Drosophila subobscura TaxID=7241 RepID=UPI00155A4A13|nr:uncharacterized protein LOC117900521 isoform X2 [Drosophila subobscura]
MSTKSIQGSSCSQLLLLLLLLPALLLAASPGPKQSARIAKSSSDNNASISLVEATSKAAAAEGKTFEGNRSEKQRGNNANKAGSKYEIRGVAGEPHYKSVNLTWEVEFVPSDADTDTSGDGVAVGATGSPVNVTNMSIDVEPPKAFQIFYCEMQNYGPQRCRVKLVNSTAAEVAEEQAAEVPMGLQVQHFAAAVDNLRMATRYSFHVRPATQRRLHAGAARRSNARAELHDENEIESSGGSGHLPGQSIIIPTKGFSAHATQCLPHASEIEVETGPYFGGRIVVDGGNCGVKGDASDAADKYTMRIDHKKCGSMVKPETNTVETFITVQENLGIFTHSTRRFVVVCSYQSGMQTVRASFTVPGKNGVAAAYEPNDPFEPDDDQRLGRELRQMRYVNKSELVLRESESESESVEQAALVEEALEETTLPAVHNNNSRQQGRALSLASLTEVNSLAEEPAQGRTLEQMDTKYAKLVVDQTPQLAANSWSSARSRHAQREAGPDVGDGDGDEGEAFAPTLRYISSNLSSVLVTVSISVIIISICLVLLQRQRQRLRPQTPAGHRSSTASMVPHLPHKTLPRALQQQQYQCTL